MLNYPNLAFYSLVSKIEYCYSRLATPENLYTYGGLVLGYICRDITQHNHFMEHFESMFRARAFDVDTTNSAFRYYVKVFGNLRLKDLCRKYNSQLSKSTTVGLRQRLATKGPKGRVSKREKSAEKEDEQSAEELHESMMEVADNGASTAEMLESDGESDSDVDLS